MRRSKNNIVPKRRQFFPVWRWGIFAVMLLMIVAFGRSSSAEFETPFIDTTNGTANVEFRGVWAFDRGYDNTTDATPAINRYEAFAVGMDTTVSGCLSGSQTYPARRCNGAIFLFDGSKWIRVISPFTSLLNGFELNAITGQEDPSYGSLRALWIVGADGQVQKIANYTGVIGTGTGNHQFGFPITLDPPNSTLGLTDNKKDFYAVDAVKKYDGLVLGGGQEGLLFTANGAGTPVTITPPAGTGPSVTENITGVSFVSDTVAYVTTSTFEVDATDGGKRMSPFKRTCAASSVAKVYKADFSANTNGVWSLEKTDSNNCFYGLTTALSNTFAPVIWVASEKGVYRLQGTNWELASAPTPYYSATAISQRSGTGTNLLLNEGFTNNGAGSSAGWTTLGTSFSRYYKTSASSACAQNVDETYVTNVGGYGTNGDFIKVTNRAVYTNSGCTSRVYSGKTLGDGFTTGVVQNVPFTTTEGQRFKISGDYKVEFPSTIDPVPSMAQGGVVVSCGGSNLQEDPKTIDCSVSNRKLVRTKDRPTLGTDDISGEKNWSHLGNGWIHFEMIVSRQDGIFSRLQKEGDLRVTKRKLDLQIRCEATFGATVSCDNLKVEPLDEPATKSRTAVTVIAAGKDIAANGIAINEDALTVLAFKNEIVPAKVRTEADTATTKINSIFAVGTQHVFAVGQGVRLDSTPYTGLSIFNRTPSTLKGSIWAGAFSRINDGPTTAGVGEISVSCIDDKGATNDQPTLCQRVPESYGMSLGITLDTDGIKIGSLTGRGWFGSTGTDSGQSLDLGSCKNSLDPNKYSVFTFQKLASEVAGSGACDYKPADSSTSTPESGSRRCKVVKSDGSFDTTLTNISCLTNFDCLGRCEKDAGFTCLKDSDCRVEATATSDQTWLSFPSGNPQFGATPSTRLSCGSLSSPLACTPTGWLSFNATDFSSATPPSGTFEAKYNTLYTPHNDSYSEQFGANKGAHELSGWGRFMTLASKSGTGWVSLRGVTIPEDKITGAFLYGCRNCDGGAKDKKNCAYCQDSSNHSCVPSDVQLDPGPDQYPQSQCYNVCKGDTNLHCSTESDCVNTNNDNLGPCITPGYCSNTQLYCQNDNACGTGTCIVGSVCSTAGAKCAKYGVNLDTTTGKFSGYAWSQDFGWLNFQNVSYGGNRILQTRLGDIYATGQIGDSTVPLQDGSNCNSTFLITSASSITGFCSTSGDAINSLPTKQPNSTAIPLLSAENTYQNVLGRFDVVGIETQTPANSGKNKYGSSIVPLCSAGCALNNFSTDWLSKMNANLSGGKYLGGKVYTIGTAGSTTTYRLDQVMNFNNSDDAAFSGAGILIVNGNLLIGEKMTYNANAVPLSNKDLRRLASLTIVVKGDLTIENTVQDVVGAYYATDTINTATDDLGTNQYPLTVKGLMIAKEFNFKRKFAGTIENPLPSELIIYDGRLQSNPMLGMTDFASALPNSVSTAP